MCKTCYGEVLLAGIADGLDCVMKTCPFDKCEVIVDQQAYKALLVFDEYKKYLNLLVNHIVDTSDSYLWCPGPGCERALYFPTLLSNIGQINIQCVCSQNFCSICQRDAHRPLKCKALKQWNTLWRSGKDDDMWMKAFTKKCPKCNIHIQKNQGCMHM